MNELQTLEDYERVASVLATTPEGSAILKRSSNSYHLVSFRKDLKDALRRSDLEYARLHIVRKYATKCSTNGAELQPLHQAIARVCQEVIDRHSWWKSESIPSLA